MTQVRRHKTRRWIPIPEDKIMPRTLCVTTNDATANHTGRQKLPISTMDLFAENRSQKEKRP